MNDFVDLKPPVVTYNWRTYNYKSIIQMFEVVSENYKTLIFLKSFHPKESNNVTKTQRVWK